MKSGEKIASLRAKKKKRKKNNKIIITNSEWSSYFNLLNLSTTRLRCLKIEQTVWLPYLCFCKPCKLKNGMINGWIHSLFSKIFSNNTEIFYSKNYK